MRALIIIPAYNERENIKQVIKSLDDTEIEGIELDYLIINDCSTDDTKAILENQHAHYLDLPINLGIGGAVQAGYIYALANNYDIAIQMDGDGQHRADYLKYLIEPIAADEADVVIGSRFITKEGFQSSSMRRLGINFLSALIKAVTGIRLKDATSGFRAVNRSFIYLFANEYAQDYPEPEAIVTCAKYNARIMEVPVIMNERMGGNSSIRGMKSVYYMIKVSIAILIARISSRNVNLKYSEN